MTVLPGSLDYLYHNGVLDHIPYEAYEMSAGNSGMNNYMDSAMSGKSYRDYKQSQDMFESEYSNPYRVDKNAVTLNEEDKRSSIRNSLLDGKPVTKEKVVNTSSIKKGIAGAAIMAVTLFLLLKGKKKKP